MHQELQSTGQMQGYRWLQPRAKQMGFVVQEGTLGQWDRTSNYPNGFGCCVVRMDGGLGCG